MRGVIWIYIYIYTHTHTYIFPIVVIKIDHRDSIIGAKRPVEGDCSS